MEVTSTPTVKFKSDCGKALIIVENDMALGVFHDFLMRMKGYTVVRMIEAQKQDEKITEIKKIQDNECSSKCE